MKLFLTILLGILILNLLVIATVAGIVTFDHYRTRRRQRRSEEVRDEDAHANAS